MKKVKKFILKNHNIIVTGIISLLIVIIVFMIKNLYPFGNKSFIIIDFFHQYYPMMNEFIERIFSNETFLYSFNSGLGIPFFRNIFNYLSSPFNIILFFFKNLSHGFSILIALRVILSSLTISIYLNHLKKSTLIIPLSIIYAFSSYFIAYSWNIMWMDGMIFLPLIALGIERLVENKNNILYIISLSIAILSNYYIGYMLCIFSFIYFMFYYFLNNDFKFKSFIKTFIKYALISLLSVGIVAFVIIPIFFSIKSISATHDVFPNILSFNFNILKFIFNNFSFTTPTALVSENIPLPNTASSIIALLLLPLFFINKNISCKEKIMHGILLVVMFLSLFISSLNFVWNGFHFPNDLPYRQSFIFIFVIILIIYKSILNIKHIKLKFLILDFVLFAFLLITSKILLFSNITDSFFKLNFLFLALYSIFLIISIYIKNKTTITIILTLICSIEMILCCNNLVLSEAGKNLDEETSKYSYIIKSIKSNDENFYRIEKNQYMTLNDGSLNNYYGMSIFSSMAYESVAKLQYDFGNGSNDINSFYYNMQTPLYNSIFSLKYIIDSNINNDYYISNSNGYSTFKYPLSLAFATNESIKGWTTYENPFENQNSFYEYATSIDNILEESDIYYEEDSNIYEIDKNEYEITGDYANIMIENKYSPSYLYVDSYNLSYIIANENSYSFSKGEPYIISLENNNSDYINIELHFDNEEENLINNVRIYYYSINDDKFIEAYQILNKEKINITSFKDDYIAGNINVLDDKTIFTSIAYDEGWKVFIDGIETDFYKIADSYIGFDIKGGNHKIEFKYYPKGLKLGVIISVFSVISIIIMERKKVLHFK